jgi:hypothetical protein
MNETRETNENAPNLQDEVSLELAPKLNEFKHQVYEGLVGVAHHR